MSKYDGQESPSPQMHLNGYTAMRCGARGIRTPDILLAKQALYQLSYGPARCYGVRRNTEKQWGWEELNLRPHAYQACALTT